VDELHRDSNEWTERAILNVAGMGKFPGNCTIREYAGRIWHVGPAGMQRAGARSIIAVDPVFNDSCRETGMKLPKAQSVEVYDDLAALSEAAARRIAAVAKETIAARGMFSIALAGGGTPRCCYERLRRLPVEWSCVQVYFGDERCLPCGDVQRNDSMAYETLLQHVCIPSGNVHAIPAERGAGIAAEEYAALLEQPLDLVLLGMGEDGHVASLFPGNPALESTAAVVPVFDAPKPPPERVSLGMNTLNAARAKLFLVAGTGKRKALERIGQGTALPAAQVKGAVWYVDRAAWPNERV
jgi:6-phosphogluconolactonase